MTNKQLAFQTACSSVIKKLQLRNMEGYFYKDSASCVEAVLSQFNQDSTIAWGGSETLSETGLMEALSAGTYTLIDRKSAATLDEKREIFGRSVMADYYLMSTNAITLDGELINIDAYGNRAACLIHGPQNVIIIAGMNKLVTDIKSGINRTRNMAAPANAIRLNKQTPCGLSGYCGNCYSDESMCSQIVITRRSGIPGRIKVFLVAEELGY